MSYKLLFIFTASFSLATSTYALDPEDPFTKIERDADDATFNKNIVEKATAIANSTKLSYDEKIGKIVRLGAQARKPHEPSEMVTLLVIRNASALTNGIKGESAFKNAVWKLNSVSQDVDYVTTSPFQLDAEQIQRVELGYLNALAEHFYQDHKGNHTSQALLDIWKKLEGTSEELGKKKSILYYATSLAEGDFSVWAFNKSFRFRHERPDFLPSELLAANLHDRLRNITLPDLKNGKLIDPKPADLVKLAKSFFGVTNDKELVEAAYIEAFDLATTPEEVLELAQMQGIDEVVRLKMLSSEAKKFAGMNPSAVQIDQYERAALKAKDASRAAIYIPNVYQMTIAPRLQNNPSLAGMLQRYFESDYGTWEQFGFANLPLQVQALAQRNKTAATNGLTRNLTFAGPLPREAWHLLDHVTADSSTKEKFLYHLMAMVQLARHTEQLDSVGVFGLITRHLEFNREKIQAPGFSDVDFQSIISTMDEVAKRMLPEYRTAWNLVAEKLIGDRVTAALKKNPNAQPKDFESILGLNQDRYVVHDVIIRARLDTAPAAQKNLYLPFLNSAVSAAKGEDTHMQPALFTANSGIRAAEAQATFRALNFLTQPATSLQQRISQYQALYDYMQTPLAAEHLNSGMVTRLVVGDMERVWKFAKEGNPKSAVVAEFLTTLGKFAAGQSMIQKVPQTGNKTQSPVNDIDFSKVRNFWSEVYNYGLSATLPEAPSFFRFHEGANVPAEFTSEASDIFAKHSKERGMHYGGAELEKAAGIMGLEQTINQNISQIAVRHPERAAVLADLMKGKVVGHIDPTSTRMVVSDTRKFRPWSETELMQLLPVFHAGTDKFEFASPADLSVNAYQSLATLSGVVGAEDRMQSLLDAYGNEMRGLKYNSNEAGSLINDANLFTKAKDAPSLLKLLDEALAKTTTREEVNTILASVFPTMTGAGDVIIKNLDHIVQLPDQTAEGLTTVISKLAQASTGTAQTGNLIYEAHDGVHDIRNHTAAGNSEAVLSELVYLYEHLEHPLSGAGASFFPRGDMLDATKSVIRTFLKKPVAMPTKSGELQVALTKMFKSEVKFPVNGVVSASLARGRWGSISSICRKVANMLPAATGEGSGYAGPLGGI